MSEALERKRQAQIDLFEAAKACKFADCEAALAAGADLNFGKHNGGSLLAWKGWRLKMGGIEWGLQEWTAPDHIKPETGDTLLMIALKCDLEPLVRWLVDRPEHKASCKNAAGKTAADIAKEQGHSSWLICGSDVATAENSPALQPAQPPSAPMSPVQLLQPAVLKDSTVERCWTEVVEPGATVHITSTVTGWLPRRLRDEQLAAAVAAGTAAPGAAAAIAATSTAAAPAAARGHARTQSEGVPVAAEAKHLRATIAARDLEIAELKEALSRVKLAKEKSDESVAELSTRVRILESTLKSTKPLWLK
jgi:hypothetical protein